MMKSIKKLFSLKYILSKQGYLLGEMALCVLIVGINMAILSSCFFQIEQTKVRGEQQDYALSYALDFLQNDGNRLPLHAAEDDSLYKIIQRRNKIAAATTIMHTDSQLVLPPVAVQTVAIAWNANSLELATIAIKE